MLLPRWQRGPRTHPQGHRQCDRAFPRSTLTVSAADSLGRAAQLCGGCVPAHDKLAVEITASNGRSLGNATGVASASGDFCILLTNAPAASNDTYTVQVHSLGNSAGDTRSVYLTHTASMAQYSSQGSMAKPPSSPEHTLAPRHASHASHDRHRPGLRRKAGVVKLKKGKPPPSPPAG